MGPLAPLAGARRGPAAAGRPGGRCLPRHGAAAPSAWEEREAAGVERGGGGRAGFKRRAVTPHKRFR